VLPKDIKKLLRFFCVYNRPVLRYRSGPTAKLVTLIKSTFKDFEIENLVLGDLLIPEMTSEDLFLT